MLAERDHVLHLSSASSAASGVTGAVSRPAFGGGLEAFYRASPRSVVVAIDMVVVASAALLSGGTRIAALSAAVAFLVGAAFSGLYVRRSTLEAQGLGWYLRLLPLPLLTMSAGLALAGHGGVRKLVVPLAATAAVLVLLRAVAWVLVAGDRRRGRGLRPVLLVGPSTSTAQMARRIEAYPEAGLEVAGTFAPTNTNGDRSRARALLKAGSISYVLVSAEAHDDALLDECARWSNGSAVDFGMVLPVGTGTEAVGRVGDLGVIMLGSTTRPRQHPRIKRALDIALSASLLLLLAPVLMIVSLAVYLYDRGPVVYRQRRVGLNNREFTIWKFRSMVPGADRLNEHYASSNMANGLLFKLPDDPRVTPVGDLIRRLSIDELPQLVNVLKGDRVRFHRCSAPQCAARDYRPVAGRGRPCPRLRRHDQARPCLRRRLVTAT